MANEGDRRFGDLDRNGVKGFKLGVSRLDLTRRASGSPGSGEVLVIRSLTSNRSD
ncbi:hypothetical protein TIFTF001_013400 [Ficus carica]|uniref:Uncharacterized protein n=1 Tax=Ficus carica TaxID=3494 RepID=A0AA88D783_FICCA|nr:hypothetical protein TIFTF001_013400 [Ficus carica]